MADTDDRIVLPLGAVREAARLTCRVACQGGIHMRPCLVPYVEQRDALVAADGQRRYTEGLDPDCIVGGAKHLACTGCVCECHRFRRWCSRCAAEFDSRVEECKVSGLCLTCLNGPVPS